jgi:hypothetical protein
MSAPATPYCDAFIQLASLEQPIEPFAIVNHLTNRGDVLMASYDGGATFAPFALDPDSNAHQLAALVQFIRAGVVETDITCAHSSGLGAFSAPFRQISSTEIQYSTRPWNALLAPGWNPDVRVFKIVPAEQD